MTLDIGVEIPEDHVTQKGSFFGVTGTGKSNGGGVILEEYHKKNIPYVMVDVLGAHWGIAEKYSVTIMGGKKGLPLYKDQGDIIAQQIFDFNIKHLILDFSEWNDFEMQIFMHDFGERLFALHEINRVPRHVFIEEAEVFCPQVGYDKSKLSLLTLNKIMKRGRALGLGMTLISQRPQDVNKKTLSQSQFNILMHLEGVQELKVVREIFRSETKDKREELVRTVMNAQKGEALIYSPQWLGVPKKFKFRLRETFHSGYTPELGKVVEEPNILPPAVAPPIHVETDETKAEDESKSNTKILLGALMAGFALYMLVSLF